MGAKYNNAVISGFNSNPPPDDGSTVDANEITWAKHLDKLAQPILTLAQTINTRLVTHFDEGPIAQTTNFTLSVANYNQVIEFNGAGLTATLPDASTVGTGFFATIVNASTSEDLTIDLATAGNTLQGIAAGTITLKPNQFAKVMVNTAVNGYLITSLQQSFNAIDRSHWPTVALSSVDDEHDIEFIAGRITDSTGTTTINLPANLIKQVDIGSGWVEGTDASGLADAVTLANDQTLHMFVIAKPDGTADAGFDTDINAANLLADATEYTVYRRIATMYTDGSMNWVDFIQTGRHFTLGAKTSDVANTVPPTTPTAVALGVPTGIKLIAKVNVVIEADYDFTSASGDSYAYLQLSDGNLASGVAATTGDLVANTLTGHGNAPTAEADREAVSTTVDIPTNTSGEIFVDSATDVAPGVSNSVSLQYAMGVSGWIDELIL